MSEETPTIKPVPFSFNPIGCLDPMGTPPALDKLVSGMTSKFEDTIREAVSRLIGEDWTPSSLRGRCQIYRFDGSPFETFVLDGVPILEVGGIEMKTEYRGDSVHMVSSRKYRFLIE